ncbi:SagB/ThcOx family dehydrogenase [Halopenitus sp. H-Gu1]|uniref:SagB/ThcOx family dehydrogenase n=1 Tax=Halopenitus sp. H-Gu1 TaxID=3242697 RepID=UPI00359D7AAC
MRTERSVHRTILPLLVVASLPLILGLVFGAFGHVRTDGGDREHSAESVSLPTQSGESDVSVEEAIANRRSRREYGEEALSRRELGQLLWAAQGVTEGTTGYRAAPSAGALYPLEVYVVVGTPGVDDLEKGIYHYRPENHELTRRKIGTVQSELRAAGVDQEPIGEAAIDIVVCAVDERATGKYGERGRKRYVPMEAGHAGENLYLQAEALGLATVSIGAFSDDHVRDVLGIPTSQRPLYIFPVGGRT